MPVYDDGDGGKTRLKKDGTPDRRKPPEKHQFKRGQSGNPSGRPKRQRTFSAAAADLLDQTVVVRMGDKKEQIPKADAIVHALIAKAMTGDPRAARTLRDMLPPPNPEAEKVQQANEKARKEFIEFVHSMFEPLRPFEACELCLWSGEFKATIPKWIVEECWRRYDRETRTFDHGERVPVHQLPEHGGSMF